MKHAATTLERRHEPRTRTVNPVNVQRQDRWGFPIDQRLGRTLDLSHNGVRVELDHEPEPNETVELTLAIGPKTISVKGRVRSIRAHDDGRVELGLQFLNLEPQTYDLIHEFLKRRKQQRAVLAEAGRPRPTAAPDLGGST